MTALTLFGAILLQVPGMTSALSLATLYLLALTIQRMVWPKSRRGIYLGLCIVTSTLLILAHSPGGKQESGEPLELSVLHRPRKQGRYRLVFQARVHPKPGLDSALVTVTLDGPPRFPLPIGSTFLCSGKVIKLGESLSVVRARWSQCLPPKVETPNAWRDALLRRFEKALEGVSQPSQGLIKSALLGRRQDLNKDTKRLFRKVGVAHLLAVSGLHVTLIAGVIFALLRLSGARYSLQIMAALGFTWIYVWLVGFRPATIRATILLSCYMVSRLLGLRRDPWSLLCLAAILILLYQPNSLFDIGAQLSFASFSGLVYASHHLSAESTPSPRGLGYTLSALAKSLMLTAWAFLSSAPFVLYHFGVVEPTALLANLPAVPLFSLFLTLALVGTLLGAIHPSLGLPVLKLSSGVATILLETLAGFEGLLPSIAVADFRPTVLFAPPVLVLCAFFYWRKRAALCIATFALALLILVASIPKPEAKLSMSRCSSLVRRDGKASTLRFDGRRLSLVTEAGARPIRLDSLTAREGRWSLEGLVIEKISPEIWRFEKGTQSVLWIQGSRTLRSSLKDQKIGNSTGLIIGRWIGREGARGLRKAWKGEWVLCQGSFATPLKSRVLLRELTFQVQFSESLEVKGLKKQQKPRIGAWSR